MESFVQESIDFIVAVSQRAAELDGRLAFALGLVTWFLVEQAIRRFAGLLRRAILLGALAALGFGLAYLIRIIMGGNG